MINGDKLLKSQSNPKHSTLNSKSIDLQPRLYRKWCSSPSRSVAKLISSCMCMYFYMCVHAYLIICMQAEATISDIITHSWQRI